jgi:rhamnulokinase
VSVFVAVDLGASSGRVMLGRVSGGHVELAEAHRFPLGPQARPGGGLRWDIERIHDEVAKGLRKTEPAEPVSIGLDAWAVDYGLVDGDGRLTGDVRCYRDPRTDGMADVLRKYVDDSALYAANGLQYLPFNTVYQLLAEPDLAGRTMLLVPDLLAYRLTGEMGAEVTNASTTGLLDATTRDWAWDLVSRTPIPPALLPPLRRPGETIGVLEGGTPIVSVASHDTASAVAAVPADGDRFAYISCGTWSLVGLELPGPVLTEAARVANFTNEAGLDGTVRFLRNTMGLWLLSESLRIWGNPSLDELLAAAGDEPAFRSVVNPDDAVFLAPGDIPGRIAQACRDSGQSVPGGPAAMVRTILESLALAHASSVQAATRLSGHPVDVVHLVGGGSRNRLLCQLTADACGLPLLAGPVEASALGNILVQARAAGLVTHLRDVSTAESLVPYEPRGDRATWRAAGARVGVDLDHGS